MQKLYTGKVPFSRHDTVKKNTHWTGTFSHHVFSLTLSGSADYLLDGKYHNIGIGDFLHFIPGTWQDWKVNADEGWDVYFIIMDVPSNLNHLFPGNMLIDGMSKTTLNNSDDIERIYNVFEEINEWELERKPLYREIIVNKLEYILLLIKNSQQPSEIMDCRVQKARNFLHHSLETYITLDDLVAKVGLSKARLSGLFKEAVGCGPIAYLEKMRMERAAQLLALTAEHPQDIAGRLCYTDPGYFNKRFKAYWGLTPRQYRLREREK